MLVGVLGLRLQPTRRALADYLFYLCPITMLANSLWLSPGMQERMQSVVVVIVLLTLGSHVVRHQGAVLTDSSG